MSKNIIKNLAKNLELLCPEDINEIVSNIPFISIIGDSKIVLENFKNILEYSYNLIKINTMIGIFEIHGNNLVLKELNKNKVLITGELIKFEFSKKI